jgi:hypothetical protein
MSYLILAACAPAQSQVVRETVVITQVVQQIVTSTPPPATSTLIPTDAPTTIAFAPTATATSPRLDVPPFSPTPPPPAPTPPRLLVAAIPGDKDKIDGQIIYPDYGSGARTELWFQVKARDPRKGNKDGAGIKSVDFSISDKTGEVYKRTENNAAYCAFGGGEPDCNIFHFADNGYKWPGTNKPIQNGQHTLTVKVHPSSGDDWGPKSINFQIQVK